MEPFYLCSSEIFGLSNSTAVVYNFLCRVNNVSTGRSFYSRSKIAAACHVSVSTVIRAFRTLSAKGLLEIKQRFDHGRQTSNDYILIDNPQIKIEPEQSSPKGPEASSISAGSKDMEDRPRFFKCGFDAFERHLTPNETKIYSYLIFRAGKDGCCMPSKKDIAADCSVSVSTVWRSIRNLNEAGLVDICPQTRSEVFGNGGASVNLYILKSAPEDAETKHTDEKDPSDAAASTAINSEKAVPNERPGSNAPKDISEPSDGFSAENPGPVGGTRIHRPLSSHFRINFLFHARMTPSPVSPMISQELDPERKLRLTQEEKEFSPNWLSGAKRLHRKVQDCGLPLQIRNKYAHIRMKSGLFSQVEKAHENMNGEIDVENPEIIGLPVLISARCRVVLD